MRKQIAASVAAFIIIFTATIWLSLPYENFARQAMAQAGQSGIKLETSGLKSGPFSTDISDLFINENPIGDIHLSYSPITLLTRSISFTSSGAVESAGVVSPAELTAEGSISSGLVNSQTSEATFNGDIKLKIKANLKSKTATVTAYAEKATINTPMGPMAFERINAEADYQKGLIIIKKLTSEDDLALNLKGEVKINMKRPEKSTVNISGTFNLLGQDKNITLKGSADKLTPSIR
jgi:hypothetical protein